MATYVRPYIEPMTFRDAEGGIIEYGHRWTHGPPDDSYSVTEHLERFAPLHTVGTALIEHLISNYEVTSEEGYHVTNGLLNAPKPDEVVRVVRLTPLTDGGAPIVFILTGFPGVRLFAGGFFTAAYPSCGCNACDENWIEAADELEWQTLAIVGGGLTEEVSEPRRPKWSVDWKHGFVQGMGKAILHRLRAIDGSIEHSGEYSVDDVPADVLAQGRARLEELAEVSPEGNWRPWVLK